jgi:hypothetical protein
MRVYQLQPPCNPLTADLALSPSTGRYLMTFHMNGEDTVTCGPGAERIQNDFPALKEIADSEEELWD